MAAKDQKYINIVGASENNLNNLQNGLKNGKQNKELIVQELTEAGIEPTRRGETLSIQEFGKLADLLHPHFSVGQ